MKTLKFLLSSGFITLICFVMIGCATTLPPKGQIREAYSLDNFKSYTTSLRCDDTKVYGVTENFVVDYCNILDGNLKLSLRSLTGNWRHEKNNPDVIIETKLEEINGGSAAARFWVGFGAGRAITTVYVKVIAHEKVMAEQRITETTAFTNLMSQNYSNEDAILQDANLISRKIVEFVRDPEEFGKKRSGSQNDF